MKRSVRNGLAIAGMAGGLFFLGQAVASADDGGTQTADGQANSVDHDQRGTDGGTAGNIGGNVNESDETKSTRGQTPTSTAATADVNDSNVNTGSRAPSSSSSRAEEEAALHPVPEPRTAVAATAQTPRARSTSRPTTSPRAEGQRRQRRRQRQRARLPDLPDQTNNVSQSNNQTATSEDDDHGRRRANGGWDGDKPDYESVNGNEQQRRAPQDDGVTGNIGGNERPNEVDIDIDTDVDGGDGGRQNYSNVNTGLQDVVLKCIAIGGGDASASSTSRRAA